MASRRAPWCCARHCRHCHRRRQLKMTCAPWYCALHSRRRPKKTGAWSRRPKKTRAVPDVVWPHRVPALQSVDIGAILRALRSGDRGAILDLDPRQDRSPRNLARRRPWKHWPGKRSMLSWPFCFAFLIESPRSKRYVSRASPHANNCCRRPSMDRRWDRCCRITVLTAGCADARHGSANCGISFTVTRTHFIVPSRRIPSDCLLRQTRSGAMHPSKRRMPMPELKRRMPMPELKRMMAVSESTSKSTRSVPRLNELKRRMSMAESTRKRAMSEIAVPPHRLGHALQSKDVVALLDPDRGRVRRVAAIVQTGDQRGDGGDRRVQSSRRAGPINGSASKPRLSMVSSTKPRDAIGMQC